MPASVQSKPSNLKYLPWQENYELSLSWHIQGCVCFSAKPGQSYIILKTFFLRLWNIFHSYWKTQAWSLLSPFIECRLVMVLKSWAHHNGGSHLHISFPVRSSQVPFAELSCITVRGNQLRTLNQADPGCPVRKVQQRASACSTLLSSDSFFHNDSRWKRVKCCKMARPYLVMFPFPPPRV